jgi:Zn-dependent alcohol dehydrogenase
VTLEGSCYGSARRQAGMPRLLQLYRSGKLPIDRLISRRHPLDRVNEAYCPIYLAARHQARARLTSSGTPST